MAVVLVAIAAIIVVVGGYTAFSIFFGGRETALEKLGVSNIYPRSCWPGTRIEAYREFKEQLRSQYAKDAVEDQQWMSQLPAQAKDMLKYRLMQRAIGGMEALQKIDADARGYWRLFSKGMITRTFWNSVTEAEKDLTQELENIKVEASCVEPTQDPQGIISEAMQFVLRYGSQMSSADAGSSADAVAEMMRHSPPPGHCPPGCAPGGMSPHGIPAGPGPHGLPGPPGAMRPPGPPGAMQAPPRQVQQVGGEEDGYSWKQDTDELEVAVIIPSGATKTQLKVTIAAKKLKVEHAGTVLAEGLLAGACCPEGSTWTMSKGRVVISLEKADPRPWPSLFMGKT